MRGKAGDETSTSIAEALDSVNELETELGQSKEAMYKLSYVVARHRAGRGRTQAAVQCGTGFLRRYERQAGAPGG